jgi:hypothetical protein
VFDDDLPQSPTSTSRTLMVACTAARYPRAMAAGDSARELWGDQAKPQLGSDF